MAIEIGITPVITNDLKLQSITGADGKYDNFQPNVTTISANPSVNLSMANPYQTMTLGQNTTFTPTDIATGRTSILTIDCNSFTPSFSGVAFAEDTTPTWSEYQYWTIAFVCWSSSIIRAVAQGYDSSGGGTTPSNDIPSGTTIGRIATAGEVTYTNESEDTNTSGGGPASATSGSTLKAFHGSSNGGSFIISVYKNAGTTGQWYNGAGTQSTLQFESAATPPVIYQGPAGVTPVAIKLVVDGVDNGWVNVPNVGDEVEYAHTATANSNVGEGPITVNRTSEVQVFGRASGYDDTLLATFKLYARAYAHGRG